MIANIMYHMRKRKINIDCMPTEKAVGAYNFLVNEDRLVCAALIPPEIVTIVGRYRQKLLTNIHFLIYRRVQYVKHPISKALQ